MLQLLAVILYSTSLALLALMLLQYLRGTCDLMSLRNFFLLGFIVFQTNNAGKVLWHQEFGEYQIVEIPGTPSKFVFLALSFLVLFLLAYRSGFLVNKFAASRAKAYSVPSSTSMLTLAAIFVVTGVVCRLVLAKLPIPLFPQLFMPVGSGLLFVSVAMGGWVWAPRMFNPVVAAIVGGIAMLALVPVLMDFSRRDVVGVAAAFAWGAYHGHWKSLGHAQVLMRLGALGLAGFILLSAHTAIRGIFLTRDVNFNDLVQLLRGADVGSGATDLASGQEAGAISMWIIETRPEQISYDPLHTARMFILHPIPRMIFPGKPVSLAEMVPDQAGSNAYRAATYNVGPGIIGHVANDNPWLSLVPYAVFFGLFLRLLDELVRYNRLNPFVLLPIGVGLGQIVGLPRGETGHFLFMGCLNMIGAYVGMWFFVRLLTTFGFVMRYDDTPIDDTQASVDDQGGEYHDHDADWYGQPESDASYAQYADYGSQPGSERG